VKVQVTGTFQNDAELFFLSTDGGTPGFEVVTPLKSQDGIVILTDRGFIPESLKDPAKRPESRPSGEATVTGVLRRHVQSRGPFTPDNDPESNIWYWWDVPAMLSSIAIAPDMQFAPFILQELPGSDAKRFPRAAGPEAQLSNNHLQYAITWFSFAVTLLVIAGLFIRKQRKTTDA
jgi:surfeit locus 1 family protein